MGKDRVRKPKVEKITWKLKNSRERGLITCAVMSWDDYEHLESMFFEKGWEQRRIFEEKREVENAKKSFEYFTKKKI